MTTWIIRGGRLGGGTASVTGFKHALVLLVGAAVLADRPSQIANVPLIDDATVLTAALRHLEADTRLDADAGTLQIDPAGIVARPIPEDLSARAHGVIYLVPALLGRLGQVRIGAIGGCRIGSRVAGGTRPVGHVLAVLERFGARFSFESGWIVGRCPGFRGVTVDLAEFATADERGRPTGPCLAGATKAAILAAAVAKGRSVLRRPYRKQDVGHLLETLRSSGVDIDDDGETLAVQGAAGPIPPFTSHLPPDLLQVMTLVALAVHWRTDVTIADVTMGAIEQGLASELEYLTRMGVELVPRPGGIQPRLPGRLQPVDIDVTPGSIFSDSQPFFALMLTSAEGRSRIREQVWVDRFDHVRGLTALGADISVSRGVATIAPQRPWRAGQAVRAADLRSAATLALAALELPGETRLHGVEHLSRGYEDLFGTLTGLGAEILVPCPAR